MFDEEKVLAFILPMNDYQGLVKGQFSLAKYLGCSPTAFDDMPYPEFVATITYAIQANQS